LHTHIRIKIVLLEPSVIVNACNPNFSGDGGMNSGPDWATYQDDLVSKTCCPFFKTYLALWFGYEVSPKWLICGRLHPQLVDLIIEVI
jgi:hypothetical protein